MLTKSQFESRYSREIILLNVGEGVSFNSALDNLYTEYKRLGGDDEEFSKLLIDWELE